MRGAKLTRIAPTSSSSHLDDEAIRFLQVRNDLLSEVCTDITIDDAVIEGKAQVHHFADHDLIAAHDRLLLDGVYAHDADFGIVDDRRRNQPAQLAQRGDGEGRATEVLFLALAVARSAGHAVDLAGDF